MMTDIPHGVAIIKRTKPVDGHMTAVYQAWCRRCQLWLESPGPRGGSREWGHKSSAIRVAKLHLPTHGDRERWFNSATSSHLMVVAEVLK